MDSPRSNPSAIVAQLQEAARRGDWTTAAELAALLPQHTQTVPPEDLGIYLEALKAALIAAKAARAHAVALMVRLHAAAGFNETRAEFPSPRQEFGDPADL